MDINKILLKIKKEFEQVIKTAKFNGSQYQNGNKAKGALICSQRLINYIHDLIKKQLIDAGVNKNKIFPPLGETKPEIQIEGFLKKKNQDVSVLPSDDSLAKDPEKILTVNVRSQLSSLSKNIDTLYERTFAEALNLHLQNKKQCLGEVYLIPTHEYDDKAMEENKIVFKKASKIEEYIKMFQAINKRTNYDIDDYKYERACLLIVDFSKSKPKLYSDIKDLIKDGLVPKETKVSLDGLTLENFSEDILKIYSKRFDLNQIIK